MRILLYNFVQPEDKVSGSGGVGIYLESLTRDFAERDIDLVTLSSGTSYSPYSTKVQLGTKVIRRRHTANIVNSPVIAPAYKNFFSPDVCLDNNNLSEIPQLLKEKIGDIDVFHFHNLEGLTLKFFYKLRYMFPRSLIYFTAHNYNIVCPQVNLWKEERENCVDYLEGRACLSCTQFRDAEYLKRIQAFYWLSSDLAKWPSFYRSFMLRRKNLVVANWRHLDPNKTSL